MKKSALSSTPAPSSLENSQRARISAVLPSTAPPSTPQAHDYETKNHAEYNKVDAATI
jgi:hypothetical protein